MTVIERMQAMGFKAPTVGGIYHTDAFGPVLDALEEARVQLELHPYSEWHEDQGAVLWFTFPLCEPGYFGDPLVDSWPYFEEDEPHLFYVKIDGNALHEQWERRFTPREQRQEVEGEGQSSGS